VLSRLLSPQAFEVQLEDEVKRAHRYGRALSVAVVTFAGLEGVELVRGPAAREALLAACGEAIADAVRSSDVACRTKPTEFAILFAETVPEQASWATGRVLSAVGDASSELIRATAATAAVAGLAPNEDPEALLDRARLAARNAGSEGERRVAVAPWPA
jgi:GGDEF domain-containing protein